MNHYEISDFGKVSAKSNLFINNTLWSLHGVYSQARCSEIAVTMPKASSVDSFGAVSGTVFCPQNNVAEIESGIEIYLDEEETK